MVPFGVASDIRLMDVIKQHLGGSAQYTIWALNIKYDGQMLVFGCVLGECVLLEGLAKELSKVAKSQNVRF